MNWCSKIITRTENQSTLLLQQLKSKCPFLGKQLTHLQKKQPTQKRNLWCHYCIVIGLQPYMDPPQPTSSTLMTDVLVVFDPQRRRITLLYESKVWTVCSAKFTPECFLHDAKNTRTAFRMRNKKHSTKAENTPLTHQQHQGVFCITGEMIPSNYCASAPAQNYSTQLYSIMMESVTLQLSLEMLFSVKKAHTTGRVVSSDTGSQLCIKHN